MKFHFSHPNELFDHQLSSSKICSGNEAFVRGLFEAKTQFLATYPGTPTSEIGDLWEYHAQDHPNIFYDLSVNETVAFEAAVGAAWSGLRAAVSFKHLGMNLISDALHSVMYSGIDGYRKAGLVIICGGDPDISSSTNAQDVRLFSLHTHLPILEPSTIQECKDMVVMAFELSEQIQLPVMVYTTNWLNHATGIISPYPSEQPSALITKGEFRKNFDKYLNAIHWAQNNQAHLYSIIHQLSNSQFAFQEKLPLYGIHGDISVQLTRSIINNEDNSTITIEEVPTTIGFIAAGLGWTYLEEICTQLGKDLPRLRLKLTYPIIRESVIRFISEFKPDMLVVIEDQEPFLERAVKEILYDRSLVIPIIGKNSFPRVGSLSPQLISKILAHPMESNSQIFYIKEFHEIHKPIDEQALHLADGLPIREPTFCPGCSHRNVFYSLRKACDSYNKKTGIEPIYGGDIGCYTMSMSEPYRTMDWLICMGAGVGIANGVAPVIDPEKQHVIAMIGDSTFFHSGIPAILNLVKSSMNVTVLILDNYYTSMTGHQMSPSTPANLNQNLGDENTRILSISKILEPLVPDPLMIMDGYSIRTMIKQFKQVIEKPGVKFVLVKAECALQKDRRQRRIQQTLPSPHQTIISITEDCTKCDECFEVLGCTAIQSSEDTYYIDMTRCIGEECKSCVDICPNSSIHVTEIWKEPDHLDSQEKGVDNS
ncbi:MAG: thiamine pyrophosphate-dependent enzyme [Promethearchaeota archaeon]